MKKTNESVSQQVDEWIHEADFPPSNNLKPIRQFDGLYPDDPEEAEAYWDFISWYMKQEHQTLLYAQSQFKFGSFGDDAGDVVHEVRL